MPNLSNSPLSSAAHWLPVVRSILLCLPLGFPATSCKQRSQESHAPSSKQSKTHPWPRRDAHSTDSRLVDSAANPREFSDQISGLNKEQLFGAWESLQDSQFNIAEKRGPESLVIEALVGRGAYDEAKDLIFSTYGVGSHRGLLVFSLFSKSDAPLDQLLDKVRHDFPIESDFNSALSGFRRNIAGEAGTAKLREFLSQRPQLKPAESRAIAGGLAAGIDLYKAGLQHYMDPDIGDQPHSSQQREQRYGEAESLLQEMISLYPGSEEILVSRFLFTCIQIAPEQALGGYADMRNLLSPAASKQHADRIAVELMATDPRNGIEQLQVTGRSIGDNSWLRPAFEQWLELNSTQASDWFETSIEKLNRSERDFLAHALVDFSVDYTELDTAWKWTREISDPKLRKQAEGQVWQVEKTQIIEKARNAPQQTIESIVSGDSMHETYWLQAATDEWLAKDAGQARAWYDANSRSLTAEQNEHIAMAYARKAIKDGDQETANQWATQVLSDERKAKLQAEIDQSNKH